MGNNCGAHTFPYIEVENKSAQVEHEATTSKIGEDQIFYCNQRGINTEDAVALIVNGYAKEVLKQLPMEFAVEAQKLLALTLEGMSRATWASWGISGLSFNILKAASFRELTSALVCFFLISGKCSLMRLILAVR